MNHLTPRRTFAAGALAGLVLWPLLAFAIAVAVNIGNAKRRAASLAAAEVQRRDWAEFEKAHPELGSPA